MGARRAAAERGFTLAEMLITLVVFSIGTLGVMAVHTAAVRANQSGRLLERAKAVSDQVMESLRAVPMATLAPTVPVSVKLPDVVIDSVAFHRRYSVSAHGLNPNLRLVWVQVSYGEGHDESDLHAVTVSLVRTQVDGL
jgi:prepilin-type N-terminal cleavage/methylation domain-containing protein